MLRITQMLNHKSVLLKLEGRLLEPWIAELRSTWQRIPNNREIGLDLSAVTFTDADGAALLQAIIDRGARLVACSAFISQTLHREEC